jgi:hypothetical protein
MALKEEAVPHISSGLLQEYPASVLPVEVPTVTFAGVLTSAGATLSFTVTVKAQVLEFGFASDATYITVVTPLSKVVPLASLIPVAGEEAVVAPDADHVNLVTEQLSLKDADIPEATAVQPLVGEVLIV